MFSLNDVGFLGSVSTYDADALAYIRAVEIADTQELEPGVRDAINAFVLGCKTDGIWTAIKASCILAGARTLAGALVPLVGTAPTNVGGLFVSGDYNRETGLVGNGSTKWLNSNRNNNADPQNSNHRAAYVSTASTTSGVSPAPNTFPAIIGCGEGASGSNVIGRLNGGSTSGFSRNNSSAFSTNALLGTATATVGISRSSSSSYTLRFNGNNTTVNTTSQTPISINLGVFNEITTANVAAATSFSDARLAFYSIGESLNLALLDTRVTTLISAIAAAIP
jgi:hypothetical protein